MSARNTGAKGLEFIDDGDLNGLIEYIQERATEEGLLVSENRVMAEAIEDTLLECLSARKTEKELLTAILTVAGYSVEDASMDEAETVEGKLLDTAPSSGTFGMS